ncbi:hypothetical protein RKD37_002459 [Streptomyces ambofaciens]
MYSSYQALEDRLDRRVLPGVRLQVVDGVQHLDTADLGDHRGHREGDVVRVLAGVGPAGHALLLGLLADREHLVPGLGVLRVQGVQGLLRVPVAVHRVGVVQDPDRVAVELAHLHDAGAQRVADLLVRVVVGRRVQQRGEVGELLLAHQDAHVHLLGAGVVDEVGRVAAVEARLQGGLDLLGGGELHLGLGEGLLVQLHGVLGVLLAEAAVEEDEFHLGAVVDRERVLGGLLARLGLLLVVPAAARAGGQEAHRGYGDQAERGGPLDQIAAADARTVVLGGSGSHAQVLAFSRTQAVNRILPGTAIGSRWVVQEMRVLLCGHRYCHRCSGALDGSSSRFPPYPPVADRYSPLSVGGARSNARFAVRLFRVETSRKYERPVRRMP